MSTPCFPDRWSLIEKPPVSGIYAAAFADAVRQLREKYRKFKRYPHAFEARGNAILDTDRGLCWVDNETATTSANAGVEFRVLLMDASQAIVSVEFEIDGSQAKMRWETEEYRATL